MSKRIRLIAVVVSLALFSLASLALAKPWDGLPLPKEVKKALNDGSKSIPDQDGNGMDRGVAEVVETATGIVLGDKPPFGDSNNGCGNEDEFPREDDNNGWCGNKPKPPKASDVEDTVDNVGDLGEDVISDPVGTIGDIGSDPVGTVDDLLFF